MTQDQIFFIIIGSLFAFATVSFLILRRVRRYHYEPKLLPGSYLKRKWQEWAPRGTYSKVASRIRGRGQSNPTEYAPNQDAAEEARAANAAADGVDRHTSVRSVMTLPPYSYTPKPTEQIIGREGERAGMDVVAEYPETADEEEMRREEEMESLYQIRLARRQEIADREARRQARREARERGDNQALEVLRRESRDSRIRPDSAISGAPQSAAALLAEHQSRGRQRRTSAVTYGALGLVRHDGTRLRSESRESERGGLLDGAAPMGGSNHTRTISGTTLPPPPGFGHGRTRSASSALSISTTATDVDRERVTTPSSRPPLSGGRHSVTNRSSASSDPNTNDSNLSPATTRLTPEHSSNSEGGDIGDSTIPPPVGVNSAGSEPPDYDNLMWGDAPAYTSPIGGPGDVPHSVTLERQLAERTLSGNRQNISNQAGTRQSNGSQAGSHQSIGSQPGSTQSPPSPTSPATRNARSQGVNRIPTLAPQLPQLDTLPAISVHDASESTTPASPTQQTGPEV